MILTIGISTAFSSIQISNTRVIYPAAEKDVSVLITNPGKYPVLLQSWIDDGQPDVKSDNLRTPFVLTPPLARVPVIH
ncbi:molecular chaperone [Salmonella enterica]